MGCAKAWQREICSEFFHCILIYDRTQALVVSPGFKFGYSVVIHTWDASVRFTADDTHRHLLSTGVVIASYSIVKF